MKQHFEYLWYVIRHKWFVFLYGIQIGVPLWRCVMHDMSKLLPSEWFPYAYYFYGDKEKQNEEWFILSSKYGCFEASPYGEHFTDKFNIAWNHHQKRNDHHWQYWILTEDSGRAIPMPMSRPAILEMIADWRGAGRALGKPDTQAWYKANKDKMILASDTRAWIEELLGIGNRAC